MAIVGRWSESQGDNRTLLLLRQGDSLGYLVRDTAKRTLFEKIFDAPSQGSLDKAIPNSGLEEKCRPIFNDDNSVILEEIQVVHRLVVGYFKNVELFRTNKEIRYRVYDRPNRRLIQSGTLPDICENTSGHITGFFRNRKIRKEKEKSLEKTLSILIDGEEYTGERKFKYDLRFEKTDSNEESKFSLTFYPCPSARDWPEAQRWRIEIGIPDPIPIDTDDFRPVGRVRHCSALVAAKTACISRALDFFSQTHRGLNGISDQGQTLSAPLFFQDVQLSEIQWKKELLETELTVESDGFLRIRKATSHFKNSVSISVERWAVTVTNTGRKDRSNPVSWGGHAVFFIERMQRIKIETEFYFSHVVKQIDLYHLPKDKDERATIRYESFDPQTNPKQLKRLIDKARTQQISRTAGENIVASVVDDQNAQRNNPPRFYYRMRGSLGFLRKFVALPIVGVVGLTVFAGMVPLTIAFSLVARCGLLLRTLQLHRNEDYERVEEELIGPICLGERNGCERLVIVLCDPLLKDLFTLCFLKSTNAVWPRGNRHNCMSWVREKLSIANVALPTYAMDAILEMPVNLATVAVLDDRE